ncbi:hypothetical protein RSOL_487740, partial [Rhizoctonia solani AG-3 Rhs1AP]
MPPHTRKRAKTNTSSTSHATLQSATDEDLPRRKVETQKTDNRPTFDNHRQVPRWINEMITIKDLKESLPFKLTTDYYADLYLSLKYMLELVETDCPSVTTASSNITGPSSPPPPPRDLVDKAVGPDTPAPPPKTLCNRSVETIPLPPASVAPARPKAPAPV